MVKKRKIVLFVGDDQESHDAAAMLEGEEIEYVHYHVRKFEEGCCGEVPTTVTPSIFAPDGVYKGLDGVRDYIAYRKSDGYSDESETAYW